MVKLVQEINARIRVRGHMSEDGGVELVVQVSAPYGEPVDAKSGPHEVSVRFEDRIPGEMRSQLKDVLTAIRDYTEQYVGQELVRSMVLARDTALRLGEIKEG